MSGLADNIRYSYEACCRVCRTVTTDPESWVTLSKLLDEMLDVPQESRASWLESLAPAHADVLPVLRQMMLKEVGMEAEGFLNTLPGIPMPVDPPGAIIGPYHLLRKLGQGGMGTVWLAERPESEIKRPVALKLPIVTLHNPSMAERFARERDILAQLTHPYIARLYDAGVTNQGQPYLALEYIEGEKITAYCDQRCVDLKSRLRLFLQVLRAVQYAHTNLIVHRDLKPANILVTNDGEVRLLDFGIAKLLTEGEANETELTRIGGRALTLDYASPEQIAGGTITTASDVYSLGVIFYELLTGERPYRFKRDTRSGLEDAILTADPVRPSQTAAEEAKAQTRSTTPAKLSRVLKGDLDSIALKALQKRPNTRYTTADAFAQDIEHYLAGEPVVAQPESAWYRARKFVLRNKLVVGATAAVVAALSIGLGIALWETHIAVVEKRRAQTEAATSKALNDFMQNDLLAQASARTQSGPNNRPDPDLKVRDALDRAAARIAGKFDSQPAVEASVRQTIGSTYKDLGLYAEAQQQMERALVLRRQVLGPEQMDTLHSMTELGLLYLSQGKVAPAEDVLTKVLAVQRRLLGTDHPDTLGSMNNLAIVMTRRGNYAGAATLLSEVLEVERRVLGEEHPDTVAIMHNLATDYVAQGKYGQAEELYKKAAELRRRSLGAEHPSTLSSMNSLGIVYRNEGNYKLAETILTTVLEARRRVLGEQHPDTLDSMSSLGLAYQAQARYAQAEPLLIQVLEARRRVLGEEHSTTLASVNNLAELYRREGKRQQAETLFRQLLESRRRILGADHPNTISVLASLGSIKLEEHRYADAEALLRKALAGREKTGPDTWQRYYTQSMLGASLAGLGRNAEARTLLVSGYEGLVKRQDSIPADTRPVLAEVQQWMKAKPLLQRK
jgi:serine/threonine protein kinase/tetratricopeptide (TPR) repeat protein